MLLGWTDEYTDTKEEKKIQAYDENRNKEILFKFQNKLLHVDENDHLKIR